MTSTKLESLEKLQQYARADTVDGSVLAFLQGVGNAHRDLIARHTGLLTSTVCGALGRLMKRELVDEDLEMYYNIETNRKVKTYKVKQNAQQ